jgi:hypothetical protein
MTFSFNRIICLCSTLLLLSSTVYADARKDSFDVQHYSINLSIRQLSARQIRGFTEITIISRINGLSKVRLDLLGMNVTAISQDDSLLSFQRNGEQLFINLEKVVNTNDTFVLNVHYAGQPQTDPKWGGFFFNGNYAYNMGVGMGSVPHTYGRCWFPCVDNFTDRATYTFHITTDTGFTAVCGGLLVSETKSGDSSLWAWELNQTIPTYLASVAVGKYVFVKNTYKGIPVWLAVQANDTNNLKASFAPLFDALDCFESRFGPYLFDRVGFVGVPFNAGAMEHATNIAYPLYAFDGTLANETLMAHELSHNWWGNLVTCSESEDMWMNEGWASFCEAVYLECRYGKQAYDENIRAKCNDVNLNAPRQDKGWLPVSGVGFLNTYGRHVYTKGALVAHNLRQTMGDSAFFAACRSYLNTYRFKDANSETFKNEFQRFTAYPLASFFESMVYDSGQVSIGIHELSETTDGNGNWVKRLRLRETTKFKSNQNSVRLAILNVIYRDSISAIPVTLTNGTSDELTLQGNKNNNPPLAVLVNYTHGMALGVNYELRTIKTTGSAIPLNNALFSINPRTISTDSLFIAVAHHWTPPLDHTELYEQGIRINTDRYWQVNMYGHSDSLDEIWGFFNYNGSPDAYVDNTFMRELASEDSLVLLFRNRLQPDKRFRVVNCTYQPGASKTDKSGRFWLEQLLPGEYALGIRDSRVVGLPKNRGSVSVPNLYIYPNPAEKNITVHITNCSKGELSVMDIVGRTRMNMIVENGEHRIDISTLNKGVYVVMIKTPSGTVAKKLIVE